MRLIPYAYQDLCGPDKRIRTLSSFCREILYTYIISKDHTELPDMVLGINRTQPNKNNSTLISVLII